MFAVRRWPSVAAWLAVVAAVPSIAQSPEADERFGVYTFTAKFGVNPLSIVRHGYDSIPSFLDRGNFRPLGRVIEWSGHDLAGQISLFFNIPVNISLGILRLIAAATLAFAIVWLVEAVLRVPGEGLAGNKAILAVVAPLVGASFLVSQVGGPVNLFPWLYLGTSAVAVFAARLMASPRLFGAGSIGWSRRVGFVLLGAALASTNEVAAIAIPLGAVVVVARCVVLSVAFDWQLLRIGSVRAWGYQLAGFLAVFVPVRLVIASRCASGNCYTASDFALTGAYPEAVVGRVATGFVPVQWHEGMSQSALDALGRSSHLVLIGVAFVILIGPIVGAYVGGRDPVDSVGPSARSVVALAILGGGLALVTTGLISTSEVVQNPSLRVGLAWRDSALATPAIGLIIAAAVAWVAHWPWIRRAIASRLVIAVVGLGVMLASFITTWAVAVETRENPERMLNNRIALEAVVFSERDDANEFRCSLLAEWAEKHRDKQWEFRPDQLRFALDDFVHYAHDAEGFCVELADD